VVFFLTSLVVSGLNEGLAWATRVRSKFLWSSHLHWLVHPLGIALTVLALVPGAPFWFDLLKRLTGIRRGMVGQA
jgi:hypothetical protein